MADAVDEVDEVGSTSWVAFGREGGGGTEEEDEDSDEEDVVVLEGLSVIGFSVGDGVFGSVASVARSGDRSAMTIAGW